MNTEELAQRNIDQNLELPWLNPNGPEGDAIPNTEWNPIIAEIDKKLAAREDRSELLWPNLRDGKSIACFSDYNGTNKGAHYKTYSFLLCDYDCIGVFHNIMTEIREKHKLKDNWKEIAYKDFGMGQLSRMIPEYLLASDYIVNGVVFTCVISKEIYSPLSNGDKEVLNLIREQLSKIGITSYKDSVIEDLILKVHIISYLISLSANADEKQKIFWMSDHDEIASNKIQVDQLMKFFESSLRLYSKKKLYDIIGFALPFDEGNQMLGDLLSIPDVVAGSIENYLSNEKKSKDFKIRSATNEVLMWLSNQGIGLKKYTVLFEKKDGNIHSSSLNFELKERNPKAKAINVFVNNKGKAVRKKIKP